MPGKDEISISDKATRNITTGSVTAAALLVPDYFKHVAYSKPSENLVAAKPRSGWAVASLAASAWANSSKASATKSFCKDGSQKLSSKNDESNPSASHKHSLALSVGSSMLFGSFEAGITQYHSNLNTIAKEKLKDPSFKAPQPEGILNHAKFAKAGFGVRALKSSVQVGAFMATSSTKQMFSNNGFSDSSATALAVGSVSATFGPVTSACNLVNTRQVLSMSPKTLSIKSTKDILKSTCKTSGPRGLLVGSGTAIAYTGIAQVVVPVAETVAETTVIPAKHKMEASLANSSLGFYVKNLSKNADLEELDNACTLPILD